MDIFKLLTAAVEVFETDGECIAMSKRGVSDRDRFTHAVRKATASSGYRPRPSSTTITKMFQSYVALGFCESDDHDAADYDLDQMVESSEREEYADYLDAI